MVTKLSSWRMSHLLTRYSGKISSRFLNILLLSAMVLTTSDIISMHFAITESVDAFP